MRKTTEASSVLAWHVATGAHWLCVAFGIFFGMLDARSGIQALFVINSRDTLPGVLLVLIFSFSLLPIAIIGIFRPRAAFWGAALASVLFSLLVSFVAAQTVVKGEPIGFNADPIIFFLVPCLVIAAGLWYVSRVRQSGMAVENDVTRTAREQTARRMETMLKSAGIGVGIFVSLSLRPIAVHVVDLAAGKRQWSVVVGILVIAFGPVGIVLLALIRTTWAAYAAFLCCALSLVFLLLVPDTFRFGWVLALLIEAPVGAMGWLFFASEKRSREARP